jgi:ribonuclease D
MNKAIDSRKEQLQIYQIIQHALEDESDPQIKKYGIKAMYPAVLAEMTQPNTVVKQFGNSVFILHKGDDDKAFFRAFNSDTARNYIDNASQFLQYAHDEEGLKYLVTQFEGEELSKLIKSTEKFLPTDLMKIHYLKTENGNNCVVFELLGE